MDEGLHRTMVARHTDEQLLKRFVSGDRGALGELAARYEIALLGLACGLLNGRRDLALDVVQETWLRVIRYGRSFNGRSSVKTWLYRVAINQCRNVKPEVRGQISEIGNQMSAETTPQELIENEETGKELHAALEQLGAAKRSVVLLCYHAGMTHEQAAEILEIPLGTLKSRLHAALTELRTTLAEEVRT